MEIGVGAKSPGFSRIPRPWDPAPPFAHSWAVSKADSGLIYRI